ncbi:unnamed protein product [Amoebophrya sp. A120]|nr:unnamed protein product [Amoebophrya sp. A120]|eukprot:GSA120T00009599001.1
MGAKKGGKGSFSWSKRDPNKPRLTDEEKRAKAKIHLEAFRAAKQNGKFPDKDNPGSCNANHESTSALTHKEKLKYEYQEKEQRKEMVKNAMLIQEKNPDLRVQSVNHNSLMFGKKMQRDGVDDDEESDAEAGENDRHFLGSKRSRENSSEEEGGENRQQHFSSRAATARINIKDDFNAQLWDAHAKSASASTARSGTKGAVAQQATTMTSTGATAKINLSSATASKPSGSSFEQEEREFAVALNWHENLEFLATAELEIMRQYLENSKRQLQKAATDFDKKDQSEDTTATTLQFPQLDDYNTSLLKFLVKKRFNLQVLPPVKQSLATSRVTNDVASRRCGGIRVKIPSTVSNAAFAPFGRRSARTATDAGDEKSSSSATLSMTLPSMSIVDLVCTSTGAAEVPITMGVEQTFAEERLRQLLRMTKNSTRTTSKSDLLFISDTIFKKHYEDNDSDSNSDESDSGENFIGGPPKKLLQNTAKRRRVDDENSAAGDTAGRIQHTASSTTSSAVVFPHYNFERFREQEGKSWKENWATAKWPSLKLDNRAQPIEVDTMNGAVLSFLFTPRDFAKEKEGLELLLENFPPRRNGGDSDLPANTVGEIMKMKPISLRLIRTENFNKSKKRSPWKLKMKGLLENIEYCIGTQNSKSPLFWMEKEFEFSESSQRIWIAFLDGCKVVVGTYPGLLQNKIAEFQVVKPTEDGSSEEGEVDGNDGTSNGVSMTKVRFGFVGGEKGGQSIFGFGRAVPTVTSISLQPRKLTDLLWTNVEKEVPSKDTSAFLNAKSVNLSL